MNVVINNEMKRVSNNFYTNLKKLGATGGLLLGTILLVTGAVLSALAFFEKVDFNNMEVVLIASSFALLGLGAHCLDLLEKERKAKRR